MVQLENHSLILYTIKLNTSRFDFPFFIMKTSPLIIGELNARLRRIKTIKHPHLRITKESIHITLKKTLFEYFSKISYITSHDNTHI